MTRFLLLLALFGGCSARTNIEPDKIVSNNPCIDSILAEIADPNLIGAISIYSKNPLSSSVPYEWAKQFPAIGTSAEEMLYAKPKLVLTGNNWSSSSHKAIKRAKIPFAAFGVPKTLRENELQIMAIANTINRNAQGRVLVSQVKKATHPSHDRQQTAIIWNSGGFVAGRGTVQDEMLSQAGYQNASSTFGLNQWEILPLEALLRNPPDVIFFAFSQNSENTREFKLKNRILRHLTSSSQLVTFPEKLLYCGGPSIVDSMRVFRSVSRKQ